MNAQADKIFIEFLEECCAHVSWKISDFPARELHHEIVSDEFKFQDAMWAVRMISHGRIKKSATFGLYLVKMRSIPTKHILQMKCSILDIKGNRHLGKELVCQFNECGKYGWPIFSESKPFIEHAEQFLPNGELRILFEIVAKQMPIESQVSATCTTLERTVRVYREPGPSIFATNHDASLAASLEKMWMSPKYADVTLSVQGAKFFVHKGLLASRSPKFEELLRENQVSIDLGPMRQGTAEAMVRYLYTGRVDFEGVELVELWRAAGEFGLPGLQQLCAEETVRRPDPESIPELILLGHAHKEPYMSSAAQRVFFENAKRVVDSKAWPAFASAHPAFSGDLLRAVIQNSE